MDYEKKLRRRLYIYISYICIAIIFLIASAAGFIDYEFFSGLSACLFAIGAVKFARTLRTLKNSDALERRKIYENDERNRANQTKALAVSATLSVYIAAVSVILLYVFNMDFAAKTVAYIICAYLLIYLICLFFINRRN